MCRLRVSLIYLFYNIFLKFQSVLTVFFLFFIRERKVFSPKENEFCVFYVQHNKKERETPVFTFPAPIVILIFSRFSLIKGKRYPLVREEDFRLREMLLRRAQPLRE